MPKATLILHRLDEHTVMASWKRIWSFSDWDNDPESRRSQLSILRSFQLARNSLCLGYHCTRPGRECVWRESDANLSESDATLAHIGLPGCHCLFVGPRTSKHRKHRVHTFLRCRRLADDGFGAHGRSDQPNIRTDLHGRSSSVSSGSVQLADSR